MSDNIRLLIVDDHVIVRSGVRLLLEAEPDICVVGEASNGKEALEMVEALQPTIVLMDLTMPVIDGLEATRRIKKKWPDVNVLILSMHRSDEYLFEVLKSGASGYILKAAESNDLIKAIRIVSEGETFLYPEMAQKLVQNYLSLVKVEEDESSQLSLREKEILKMLAEGYSNKEIAERLFISPSTVYSHRGNLMRKLGLSSHRELIQLAKDRGLLHDV